MSDIAIRGHSLRVAAPARSRLREFFQQKSTVAFLFTLPLILLIAVLVIYPAFYSVYLAMLSKKMDRFVWFSNFSFLFTRET
ncbi:MAG: sugar ABC transporter permease, partial [Microvirga sp.]